MCGVNGIAGFGGTSIQLNRVLKAMCRATKNRGPDATGIWLSNVKKESEANNKPEARIKKKTSAFVGIGHNLLAIRGSINKTKQPITYKHITVAMAGEIYNHDFLMNQLGNRYVPFTESDAEVLIYLYLEYGSDFVKMLDGEFSFVLHDNEMGRTIIATDRFGIKPIYYSMGCHKKKSNKESREEPVLVFSSTIDGILASGMLEKVFDETSLYHTLTLGHPWEGKTAYKGIERLQGGEILAFDGRSASLSSYFSINDLPWHKGSSSKGSNKPDKKDLKKASLELSESLKNAIKKKSVGAARIGAALSGGVDSSMITAHLMQIRQDAKAISLINPNLEWAREEMEYIGSAAARIGIEPSLAIADIKDKRMFIEEILKCCDDLVFNEAMFSYYLIFLKAQSMGVKTVLTGDGADELMLGYPYFVSLQKIMRSKKQLHSFEQEGDLYYSEEGAEGVFNTYLSTGGFFFSNHFFFDGAKKGHLFDMKYLARHNRFTESFIQDKILSSEVKGMKAVTYGEMAFKFRQTFDCLDKISMSCSVEIRLPFFDPQVVDASIRASEDKLIVGDKTKYILRMAGLSIVGKEVSFRPKIGLYFQLGDLIRDAEGITNHILNSDLAKRGIFNRRYLAFRLNRCFGGTEENKRLGHLDSFLIYVFLWHNYRFGDRSMLKYF